MESALAVRLNAGVVVPPVMPCTAPNATSAITSEPMAAAVAANVRTALQRTFVVRYFIVVLLIADDDFGHLTAEVFGVVRQMIEIGAVEVIPTCRHIRRVQNYICRLPASQRH